MKKYILTILLLFSFITDVLGDELKQCNDYSLIEVMNDTKEIVSFASSLRIGRPEFEGKFMAPGAIIRAHIQLCLSGNQPTRGIQFKFLLPLDHKPGYYHWPIDALIPIINGEKECRFSELNHIAPTKYWIETVNEGKCDRKFIIHEPKI